MGIFHSKDWKHITTPSTTSLQAAIVLLENYGAQIILAVDDDLKLMGTVTDGDIRRGILEGVQLGEQISLIMNPNPITSMATVPKDRILELMHSAGARQIPLIDEERHVVGIRLWNELTEVRKLSNSMIIMAGGIGKRLHPLTLEAPKPMLLVDGKPMLQHIIERARSQGISRFIISINYLREVIKDYFQNGAWLGVSISYLEEESPLGTAGALSMLPDQTEPFIVTNGDVLAEVDYVAILDFHLKNDAKATMGVKLFEWQHPYGVVSTNGTSIVGYEEKPVYRNTVNAGIYVLSPEILNFIEPGERLDMPSLLTRLTEAGFDLCAYLIHENWIDIGRQLDLDNANKSMKYTQ